MNLCSSNYHNLHIICISMKDVKIQVAGILNLFYNTLVLECNTLKMKDLDSTSQKYWYGRGKKYVKDTVNTEIFYLLLCFGALCY